MQELNIQAIGKTDIGKVRKGNQDSILVDTNSKIFMVADGMGGHAGGEVASKVCVEQSSEFIKQNLNSKQNRENGVFLNAIKQAINVASLKIYDLALENHSLRGMGTTATLVYIENDFAYIGHVGDSRIYLIRAGFIYQLTNDHSLVSEQLRAGIISEQEAETHQLRNVITRSVGYQEEEEVDTRALQILPGDYLILTSDGLHGKMLNREISILVSKHGLNAVDHCIDMANDRGGEDNISMVVIKI